MGQAKSMFQNTGPPDLGFKIRDPWTLEGTNQDQELTFTLKGKLPDGAEIKFSNQTDKFLKSRFVWQQEFESYRADRNVFVDRSFEMTSKKGETIQIGFVLSYNPPNASLSFKVKIIQGANLFCNMKIPKLTLAHGGKNLQCSQLTSPNEMELLEGEFVRIFTDLNSRFDEMFLDESDGAKKIVTFIIIFQFQLNQPLKIEKLPKKLEKMFVQGNEFCDTKIVCDGRIFNCHKTILSCQSEVFKGTS